MIAGVVYSSNSRPTRAESRLEEVVVVAQCTDGMDGATGEIACVVDLRGRCIVHRAIAPTAVVQVAVVVVVCTEVGDEGADQKQQQFSERR